MEEGLNELAAAVRQWRHRILPHEAGLNSGQGRRRTAGLRREEVASIAGLSVDYIVRIEQGRPGFHPSAQALAALARALRLSAPETAHLFDLASVAMPGRGEVSDIVRPSVLRLVDRLQDLPAMIVNGRGDVLAWNDLLTAVVGDLSAVLPERRNHLWLHFVAEDAFTSRVVRDGDEGDRLDRSTVAQGRIAAARYPSDQRLQDLVSELRERSTRFAALWDERPVRPRNSDVKSYEVPGVGTITLDCESLSVPDDDQTLVVYSATPRSRSARHLDSLREAVAHLRSSASD